jgi:hypothetical protein
MTSSAASVHPCYPQAQVCLAVPPAIPAIHPDILDAMAAAGWTLDMVRAACRAAWRLATGSQPAGAMSRDIAESHDVPHESRDSAQLSRDSMLASRRKRSEAERAEAKRLADRMRLKGKRAKHKAAVAAGQRDMFTAPVIDRLSREVAQESRDSELSRDPTCPPSLKEKSPRTPLKENNPSPPSPDRTVADEAPAASKSLLSPEAFELAEQIGKAAGYPDLPSQPLGWAGAAYEIQNFLNAGCPAEIIRIACVEKIGSRGPPDMFIYFRKAVMDAKKRYEAPLPVSKIPSLKQRPGATAHVPTGKPATGWQARKDAGFAALAALDERLEAYDRAAGGSGATRP